MSCSTSNISFAPTTTMLLIACKLFIFKSYVISPVHSTHYHTE